MATQDNELLGENDAVPPPPETPKEKKAEAKEARAKRNKERLAAKALLKTAKSKSRRKFFARSLTKALDHYDEALGIIERIFYMAIPVLLQKGQILEVFLVSGLALITWWIKIRKAEPGPAVAFLKKPTAEIRTTLKKMSSTNYVE